MTRHEWLVAVLPSLCTSGSSDCVEWPFARVGRGYGACKVDGKMRDVHRLALEWKLGRPLRAGSNAMHSCDNPPCFNPAHLSEGSVSENAVDRVSKGRDADRRGTKNGQAKLTEQQAREIHRRANAGEHLGRLANEFSISKSHVSRIKNGRKWGGVWGNEVAA